MATPHKLVNGIQVPLTDEEIAQRQADEQAWLNGAFDRAIADLRARRNRLLASSDWEVIMAKEKGTNLSTAFKDYRQALRDITQGLTTVEEVELVIFPEKP